MYLPKVLVGCPTSFHKAYCLSDYATAVKSLTYKNHDLLLVDNSPTEDYCKRIKALGLPVIKDAYQEHARDRIVQSRNILRQKMLDGGYDYFFSLEQDVIPPPDVVERLLVHKKDIVSGVYFTKYIIEGKERVKPLLWGFVEGKPNKIRFLDDEVEKPQFIRIKAAGLGCILISRKVLKEIPFGLEKETNTFDDIVFCKQAAEKKFELFADTSIKCRHLIAGMNWDRIKE